MNERLCQALGHRAFPWSPRGSAILWKGEAGHCTSCGVPLLELEEADLNLMRGQPVGVQGPTGKVRIVRFVDFPVFLRFVSEVLQLAEDEGLTGNELRHELQLAADRLTEHEEVPDGPEA